MVRRSVGKLSHHRWLIVGAALAIGAGTLAAGCGSLTQTTGTPGAQGTSAIAATPIAVESTPPQQLSTPGQIGQKPLAFLTPLASGSGARTDCAQGWATFRDDLSVISFCAPPDLVAQSAVDGNGPSISIADNANGKSSASAPPLSVALRVTDHPIFTPTIPLATLCVDPSLSGLSGGSQISVEAAGLTAQGCTSTSVSGDATIDEILASAALPNQPGKYLNLDVAWSSGSTAAHDTVMAILKTVQVSS